ncbi:MAG: hypothetical protein R3D03_14565 [Geminicoccaceae bacterium]
MARTFYADSRKVRASRIRDELGVQLRYPTYREGLAAHGKMGFWRNRRASKRRHDPVNI